ncbi:MAG: hypothetical protein AAGC68_03245, partial [Verrucomicrobiota bacterium]
INSIISGGNGITSPEISLYGNGFPIADGNRRTNRGNNTDFGNALRFGSRRTKSFDLFNNGVGSALTVRRIRVRGTPFRVKRKLRSVQAGRTASFSIEFRGMGQRRARGRVRVFSNDPVNPVYQFALVGRSRARN